MPQFSLTNRTQQKICKIPVPDLLEIKDCFFSSAVKLSYGLELLIRDGIFSFFFVSTLCLSVLEHLLDL